MVLLPFDIVTYVNFDHFEYVFVVIIVIKFHSIRYQKETCELVEMKVSVCLLAVF